MLDVLQDFPFLRLHFSFAALQDLRLEGFTGSTWHGALGHALARVAPEAFEWLYGLPGQEGGNPRPFVLLPEESGAGLGFSLILLGEAVSLAPVVLLAVEQLAAAGLGRQQIPLRLLRVTGLDAQLAPCTLLAEQGPFQSAACAPRALAEIAAAWRELPARAVLLRFDTRLRLKAANDVLREAPALAVLLQRLLERISALAQLYGPGALPTVEVQALLACARAAELTHAEVHWAEWSRLSGRSGQTMPWGGLLGDLEYRGELGPLLPWLALGSWLHVGAKTSFGLGHYRLWVAPR